MTAHFDEFEEEMTSRSLERAYDYVDEHRIGGLEEVSAGLFHAEVHGSEPVSYTHLSSVASLVCCASMTLCCRLRVNRRNDSAHLLRGLPSDSFPVPYFMGGYAGGTKDTK